MILLASDFDGTIAHQGVVDEKTFEAIDSFRSEGNLFVVDTGRNPDFFSKDDYSHFDYVIGCTGSYIKDKDLKTIYTKKIDIKDVECILKVLKRNNAKHLFISSEQQFHFVDNSLIRNILGRRMSVPVIKEVNDKLLQENIVQISAIILSNKQINNIITDLKTNPNVKVHVNKNSVDIISSNTNKGIGIKILNELIKADKVYTIGDELNDLDMLKDFNSFAIKSGNKKIQSYTKYVVEDIHEALKVIKNENAKSSSC